MSTNITSTSSWRKLLHVHQRALLIGPQIKPYIPFTYTHYMVLGGTKLEDEEIKGMPGVQPTG